MPRSKFAFLVYIIIGLAALGLVVQLLTNTIGFIANILMMVGIAVIISGIFYLIFFRKKRNSGEMKKYKKAVKQSKQKYNQKEAASLQPKQTPVKKTTASPKKKRKKQPSHLTVIEGNKSKANKKNRASF